MTLQDHCDEVKSTMTLQDHCDEVKSTMTLQDHYDEVKSSENNFLITCFRQKKSVVMARPLPPWRQHQKEGSPLLMKARTIIIMARPPPWPARRRRKLPPVLSFRTPPRTRVRSNASDQGKFQFAIIRSNFVKFMDSHTLM